MPEHHLLGPYIRRYLLEHVVADRNLSRNTQRSYRDAIRILLQFMRDKKITSRAIMLTAVNEVSIALQAVRLGANDYVTKPFQLEQLFACVKRVLQT